MKTIKIESSFWVGDIVYGVIAKYNELNKLECSIGKFVIKEVVTTPEDGPVKMYHIDNVDSGRGFRCADDEITKSYEEVKSLYNSLPKDMEISPEEKGIGYNDRPIICSWFINPMNLIHGVEILGKTAGVLIDSDGVKKCLLYASDGVNTKEYK